MQPLTETPPSDSELLEAYTRDQSDAAFAEIVERYQGMVYSAAMRQVGNASAAEDLTQAVFIILARKAGSFRSQTVLSGWLFRTVRFAAMDAMKIDNRRRRREQDASLDPEEEADP